MLYLNPIKNITPSIHHLKFHTLIPYLLAHYRGLTPKCWLSPRAKRYHLFFYKIAVFKN